MPATKVVCPFLRPTLDAHALGAFCVWSRCIQKRCEYFEKEDMLTLDLFVCEGELMI